MVCSGPMSEMPHSWNMWYCRSFLCLFFRTTVQGAAWGELERRNHWPAALTKPQPLSRFTSHVGQQWRYNIQRLDQQKLMNQKCMVAIHSSRKAGVAVQKGPWNNFTQANNGIFDFTCEDKGHGILVSRDTRSWRLIHYRNMCSVLNLFTLWEHMVFVEIL